MNPSLEPGRPNLYDPVPPPPALPQWWMERRAHTQPDPRDDEGRDLGVEIEWRSRVQKRGLRSVKEPQHGAPVSGEAPQLPGDY